MGNKTFKSSELNYKFFFKNLKPLENIYCMICINLFLKKKYCVIYTTINIMRLSLFLKCF